MASRAMYSRSTGILSYCDQEKSHPGSWNPGSGRGRSRSGDNSERGTASVSARVQSEPKAR